MLCLALPRIPALGALRQHITVGGDSAPAEPTGPGCLLSLIFYQSSDLFQQAAAWRSQLHEMGAGSWRHTKLLLRIIKSLSLESCHFFSCNKNLKHLPTAHPPANRQACPCIMQCFFLLTGSRQFSARRHKTWRYLQDTKIKLEWHSGEEWKTFCFHEGETK